MNSTGRTMAEKVYSSKLPRAQRGLTLIELMIAMLLSILLVLALADMYVNVSRNNQELAKTSVQIENARFAIQFLENDVVHAGYWGGFIPAFDNLSNNASGAPADVPTLAPDPCLAYASWNSAQVNALLGISVQATSGFPGTCSAAFSDKLANTDVLVVRHVETCTAGDTNCSADSAGELYLQVSNCTLEIDAGSEYSINPASYALRERDCDGAGGGTLAPKRKFVQSIYFVRDWSFTAGDGIPALVRSDFGLSGGVLSQQSERVLVEGVERFRVELGVDSVSDSGAAVDYTSGIAWSDEDNHHSPTNRGDGTPESFINCGAGCTVAQLIDTVAVRIHLLVRAIEPTAGYVDTKDYVLGGTTVPASALEDSYKRHAFSTTVRLYNVSGRRETPEI